MPKNSNCKKSWHPSRFETQEKVRKAEEEKEKKEKLKSEYFKEIREEMLNNEKEDKNKRMDWML